MKRMLYFNGVGRNQVFADGESLLVRCDGSANQRYPLRYLNGLEIRGKGMWSLAAMQLLMVRGIPIVFRGGEGQVLGYLHGVSTNRSEIADRLTEAILIDGFRTEYESWRRAAERRLLLRSVKHLRLEDADLRRNSMLKMMNLFICRQYPEMGREKWLEIFVAHLHGESSRFLLANGFDGRFLTDGNGQFGLAEDLAWMALWRELSHLFGLCNRVNRRGGGLLIFQDEVRRTREYNRCELDQFWEVMLGQLGQWMAWNGL